MFSAPIIYDYLTNAMRTSPGRQVSDESAASVRSVRRGTSHAASASMRPGLSGRVKVLYICSRPDGIFPGWKQPSEPLEKAGCIATGH